MRSELVSIAVAVAVHAAVPLLAWVIIDPNAGRSSSTQHREIAPIDIELSPPRVAETRPAPPDPTLQEPRPTSEAPPPPDRPGRTANLPAGRDPQLPVDPGVPSPEGTGTPNAPPAPTGPAPDHYDPVAVDDGRSVLTGPPGLNSPIWKLPGGLPAVPTAAPAATEAPKPRPVDKDIAGIVVRDAMDKNNKDKGFDLPGSGNVSSAVRVAVQGARDLPDTVRASFEVRIGPGGKVLSVRITGSSGGSSSVWEQLARQIQASLAGQSFMLTDAFAKGASVYVDVSSSMTLPSGSTSAVQHSGSGISFDTADIGSHKQKSVRATYRTVAAR